MTIPRLITGAWVLVADGAKAIIYRNTGTVDQPRLEVLQTWHQDNPPAREYGTSRPGRLNDAVGQHRSAVEQTDWHSENERRFLNEIASELNDAATSGKFSAIVIVAAPEALGMIRESMRSPLKGLTIAEIAKDLTKETPQRVAKTVARELAG